MTEELSSRALRPLARVIDDEETVRNSTVFTLRVAGIEAVAYESAAAFLENDDIRTPGCVILDVRMPDMNGLELQDEMLRRGIDLPIVFLTGHGDRTFADDQSIVGGLARLGEHAVMVIGHQKGRDTRERTRRNFGMTKPEGYRKALRLMKLAEKFSLPVFTFVDTPGAYPGIDAEERNQSEAIGRNIYELAKLRVPVISTIIGEGGSGGALAIAVCDSLIMLQYSTYSVISPEGCASILWKSADKAPEAAQALALTSDRLLELGLVDKVISEPLGGAHRDPKLMASTLRKTLVDQLKAFLTMDPDALVERRLGRLMNYGRFEEKCSSAYELLCQAAHESELPLEESAAEEPKTKEPETPKKPRRSCALRRKPVAKKSQVAETAETVAETAPKKPARRRPATRKTAAKKEAPEAASAEPAKE